MSESLLRKREKQVLVELLKDGRKPDKHIAKDIGTTQSTVTRIRQKLEREGYIDDYRARGNLKKAGLSIVVTTLFEWTEYSKNGVFEAAKRYISSSHPVVVFGRGEGMGGKTIIVMTAHRNFEDYETFMTGFREKWDKYVTNLDYFICSVDSIYKFHTRDAVIHGVMAGE